MTQVFISYSRRDLDLVEQLAADLQVAGLDVWYDLSGLEGGARWSREIQNAIRDSQYVIVVLSPDSVASEWVEEEILYAKNLKRIIVPLLYKKCDLPLGYLTRHYIDIQRENYQKNFNTILRALNVGEINFTENPVLKSPSRVSKLLHFILIKMRYFPQHIENISDASKEKVFSHQVAQSQAYRFPAPKINRLPENIYGKIAYQKGKDYVIANSDGTDEFVVAKASWSINSPRIAPGGETVAFSSAFEDQDSIYVINRDGSNLKRLTGPSNAKQDWYASWSPNRTKLIFARGYSVANDIFVIDNQGNNQKNLTELFGKQSINTFSEFPWSPDGQRIVFSSDRDGYLHLYFMDHNGENIQRLTSNSEARDYDAVWSPDGNTIAYVSTVRENSRTDIFTLNIDTHDAKPSNITNSPYHDTKPVWSPDGTQILFVSDREGYRELYIMNRDGSNVQRVTRTTEPKDYPSWLR